MLDHDHDEYDYQIGHDHDYHYLQERLDTGRQSSLKSDPYFSDVMTSFPFVTFTTSKTSEISL